MNAVPIAHLYGCCAMQGVHLNSTDGLVFLLAGTDGSVSLFNAANFAVYGATPAAELWVSGTAGTYSGTSYLIMQSVSTSSSDLPLLSGHAKACREAVVNTPYHAFCIMLWPPPKVWLSQDCNLVLYNSNYTTTGTLPANKVNAAAA